jgi:O-antigen/teichoic acid export membrane protein
MGKNHQKILKGKTSIKAGIVITYLRLIVYLSIGVLYPPYLLQMVGKDDNGLYNFALSIIGFILLLSFGCENSYVRFATVAEQKDGEEGLRKTNGFYLFLFAVISLFEVLVGFVVAFLYRNGTLFLNEGTPELREKLFQLILIVTLSSTSDFFMSIFAWFAFYRSRFVWEQSVILVSHVLTVGTTVLALYLGGDIFWVAWIGFAGQFLADVANVLFAIFGLKMSFRFVTTKEWLPFMKEVFLFSIWIFLIVAVNQANTYLGKIVLGKMVDLGKTVTIFTYGLQFYVYESLMAQGISNNFSPKINTLAIKGDNDDVSRLWLKASKLQMIVLFCVVGGFITCGLDFVTAWLHKSDLSSENLGQIYYLGVGFLLVWLIPLSQTVGVEVQRAYNKHRFLAVFNFLATLVGIGLTILLVFYLPENQKVYGPLFSTAISVSSGMIIATNIYYKKILKLPVNSFFKFFSILAIISVVAWAVPYTIFTYGYVLAGKVSGYVSAIIKAIVFLAIYLPAVAFVFRREIRQELTSHFKKKEEPHEKA